MHGQGHGQFWRQAQQTVGAQRAAPLGHDVFGLGERQQRRHIRLSPRSPTATATAACTYSMWVDDDTARAAAAATVQAAARAVPRVVLAAAQVEVVLVQGGGGGRQVSFSATAIAAIQTKRVRRPPAFGDTAAAAATTTAVAAAQLRARCGAKPCKKRNITTGGK
jgi:hypothetical protein